MIALNANNTRASFGLWTLAAAGACVIHIGGIAVAIIRTSTLDEDDIGGTPAIEISMETAAPRVESSALPPGPEADSSTAAPEVQERVAEAEPLQLPTLIPEEVEDPDLVTSRTTADVEQEKQPEETAERAPASSAMTASEAAAPPATDAPAEAPKSTAPVQGLGRSQLAIKTTWQKQLVAHVDRQKRYPAKGARRSVELVLSFELDRMGHVRTAGIARSSGDPAFDEAALAMLRRADPVPAPPPFVADEGLSFTMPVIFRAKSGG